tara:strand:- start:169 stop:321 length:153 start_codon:yes stop_codon:yes gene_type:complete
MEDIDKAYVAFLIITNIATFYFSRSIAIKETLDFLDDHQLINFRKENNDE